MPVVMIPAGQSVRPGSLCDIVQNPADLLHLFHAVGLIPGEDDIFAADLGQKLQLRLQILPHEAVGADMGADPFEVVFRQCSRNLLRRVVGKAGKLHLAVAHFSHLTQSPHVILIHRVTDGIKLQSKRFAQNGSPLKNRPVFRSWRRCKSPPESRSRPAPAPALPSARCR